MLLEEMSWVAIDALSRDMPVLIPTAALEQHGHHLPVFVDSILAGEISRRAERQLKDRVLMAPVLWLGNSQHHLDFTGTMSAAPRTYIDLINDVVENFLTHGFKRIVIVNGHGGNNVPGQQALFEVRQRHRHREDLLLLFACYWALGSQPQQLEPSLVQPVMGHACEWETAMMLAVRPELVVNHQAVPDVDPIGVFDPVFRPWTTKDRSAAGHIGYPAAATAAKGEKLLSIFTGDLVTLVQKVLAWNGGRWG